MALDNKIILSAGIIGLAYAFALHKNLQQPKPKVTLLEIRPAPSTIGRAVNLTSKALRYLDNLGVYEKMLTQRIGAEYRSIDMFDLHSGTKTCQVDIQGDDRGIGRSGSQYFCRRVMGWQLQSVLLETGGALERVQIMCGAKVIKIEEGDDRRVRLNFDDGSHTECASLLSWGGIQSVARSMLIDPHRQPRYTGVSVEMTTESLVPPM